MPTGLPTGPSDGGIFYIEVPLFPNDFSLYRVDIKRAVCATSLIKRRTEAAVWDLTVR